jgi:hypothetical protein
MINIIKYIKTLCQWSSLPPKETLELNQKILVQGVIENNSSHQFHTPYGIAHFDESGRIIINPYPEVRRAFFGEIQVSDLVSLLDYDI